LKLPTQAEESGTSEQSETLTCVSQECQFHFSEDYEAEGEKFHIENAEEHVVAIKVLTDETDPSTSRALLDEARGRTRLWSDSGLTASTSSYVATTINTTTTTGNTGTMMKSVSEVSVPTSTSSCLNYLAEETEEEEEVRYTASPRDDRYGIIMPASNQHQEPMQPLECIVEDAEEASVLENDYEKTNETVRRVDPFPPNDIASTVAIVEDYLEPKEEVLHVEPAEGT
uniref:Syndecan n=1 Tax=Hydatigena taeniaeformis TaxID=6205 RepID=A0A0R3X275_HYDTA